MKPLMKQRTLQMTVRKRIALIAHDNRKFDLSGPAPDTC